MTGMVAGWVLGTGVDLGEAVGEQEANNRPRMAGKIMIRNRFFMMPVS
jgi:hypothetical protein